MTASKNATRFLRYVTEWYADFDAQSARRMLSYHYENLAAEAVGYMQRELAAGEKTASPEKELFTSFFGFLLGWSMAYPMRASEAVQRAYLERLQKEAKKVLDLVDGLHHGMAKPDKSGGT